MSRRSNKHRPSALPPRACRSAEPLEHRMLMAATLPPGFQESVYVAGFDTNLLDAPSLKHVRIETWWKPREGPLASPPAATVSGL